MVSSAVVYASQRYAWEDAFRYYIHIQLGLEYCASIDYMYFCMYASLSVLPFDKSSFSFGVLSRREVHS